MADSSGIQTAVIDLDGSIKAKDGRNIGVPFKYTVAFDRNNVYLGRVKADGSVVSDGGETLGQVRYNGEVTTKMAGMAMRYMICMSMTMMGKQSDILPKRTRLQRNGRNCRNRLSGLCVG